MMELVGGGADRVEQQSPGLKDAANYPYPSERSGVGTDEDGSDGAVRLSVVLETAAHEAALILSGRLDVGSLVAFEVAVEQLALTALPSVRIDVRALTAVDRTGLRSLRAFGRWARGRGMTLRVETGGLSGCSALGLVLGVALREMSLAEHMACPIVPVVPSRPRRASVDEQALASWGA